jgi:hypothetical protein
MSTLTANVLNGSGLIAKIGQASWSAARDAASGTIDSTDNVAAGYSTYRNPIYDNSRFFMGFDTSSIPNNATIQSAKIKVYVVSRSGTDPETLNVVAMSSGNPESLATTDYVNAGSTIFGSLAYADASTSAYNEITLNASGIAAISLTGITKLAFRTTRDINNTTPTVDQAGGNSLNIDHSTGSGAANVLQLVVEYTAPTGFFALI